jgi:hypothetical protein
MGFQKVAPWTFIRDALGKSHFRLGLALALYTHLPILAVMFDGDRAM